MRRLWRRRAAPRSRHARLTPEIAGTLLLDGTTELSLNPSCLRYLAQLRALYGTDKRANEARLASVAPLLSPLRVREVQALLAFLGELKLLKVSAGGAG